MLTLEEFYASVDSDAAAVIGRLGGNRSLVERFLLKFRDDKSFSSLLSALEEGKTEEAFRMAHTLKGVSANLGIQSLYAKASEEAEFLRSGNLSEARAFLPELEDEYNRVSTLLAGEE